VLHTLRTWTPKFRVGRIKLHCDNEAVIAALANLRIKGQEISPLPQIAITILLHEREQHCI
jgi:hypothetical protein